MIKNAIMLAALLVLAVQLTAQTEPDAGKWATWFIPSGKMYRLDAPAAGKTEIKQVIAAQQHLDSATLQQIKYWNMGAPGYQWEHLMGEIWMEEALNNGILARMLLSAAIYDATVAAWDTKYTYNRPRPFAASKQVKALGYKPDSPSYPCEHSVAAGVAATIIGHFFPAIADSVQRMAQAAMASRVAAGMAYPSDTKAGFELGKRIAELEIAHTKDFLDKTPWDGKIPDKPGLWKGAFAYLPNGGRNKTVVLTNSSQFRPGPPPDFAKDMAELKNFKHNMASKGNALKYATQSVWEEMLDHKLFEYNMHLNPPRAARAYALAAIGTYDGFAACWDAKYAYWGIRPEQYDPTYSPLLKSPPFPGYPSGHAAIGSVLSEIYAYIFPDDRAFFEKKAIEGAESRFHAGIHFRTDNDVALDLGKKVAGAIVRKAQKDGAGKSH